MSAADQQVQVKRETAAGAGRTALAAFAVLAVATGVELWLAVGAGGARGPRVAALAGLLLAKAVIVLGWLMRARDRRTAALTIAAFAFALGYGVVLMLETAVRARVQ